MSGVCFSLRAVVGSASFVRLWHPLFIIVVFYVYDSDVFYVIAVDTFCDDPCSDSVQPGAYQILRFNRFSTYVEAHWFRLHRILD